MADALVAECPDMGCSAPNALEALMLCPGALRCSFHEAAFGWTVVGTRLESFCRVRGMLDAGRCQRWLYKQAVQRMCNVCTLHPGIDGWGCIVNPTNPLLPR